MPKPIDDPTCIDDLLGDMVSEAKKSLDFLVALRDGPFNDEYLRLQAARDIVELAMDNGYRGDFEDDEITGDITVTGPGRIQ